MLVDIRDLDYIFEEGDGMLYVAIPGSVPAKKNNKRIVFRKDTGKPFIISSDRALEWKKEASKVLLENGFRVSGEVSVKMYFWVKDNRRSDLDGKVATVLDALVENGVIEDDNWKIVSHLEADLMGVDKENPRVGVEITPKDKK